jgi:RNA polymerase sigma-70 factor (ECF subfamily)
MNSAEYSLPTTVTDLANLGKLFEEHRPRLLAMLRRRIDPKLRVRLDPEEVLHDAFLEAGRRWSRCKAQAALTPYAWLFGLARERLLDAYRRHTRDCRDLGRELPWPEGSSIQLGLNLVVGGTGPVTAAERNELQARMRQAMTLLKPAYKEILWMRHYEDLTFPETAAILGITENAATVRHVRALKRLKELWLQLNPE